MSDSIAIKTEFIRPMGPTNRYWCMHVILLTAAEMYKKGVQRVACRSLCRLEITFELIFSTATMNYTVFRCDKIILRNRKS